MTEQPSTDSAEMPRYKCHKEVRALKIAMIDPIEGDGAGQLLRFWDEYAPIAVTEKWFVKHEPFPGGFYVVYEDGYKSFSPAEAFEDGYTRI